MTEREHNEPDVFGKFATYLIERQRKCKRISEVVDLMTDPFIRSMLSDMPQEQRQVLRRFGKDRCYALGWPRRVNDLGEEDQRPDDEKREEERHERSDG